MYILLSYHEISHKVIYCCYNFSLGHLREGLIIYFIPESFSDCDLGDIPKGWKQVWAIFGIATVC